MAAKSNIEHWRIDATIYNDRVEEMHFITDPLRNIRRKPQTVVWHVEKFLGRGGFGEVRLERNKGNQTARAVKKIATGVTLSNSECEKELKALLEFSKPKYREAAVFVEFSGWFKHDLDIYLAMEYLALGDLERNVAAHSGKLPESEARDITRQILSGLEIMHAESFAHRDLKPQNVLVVHGPPRWWVKIADFGLSKRLTESTAYHTKSGTQHYMAPEVLDYLGSESRGTGYTHAVDIWAVGCITYRLVAGSVPFPTPGSLLRYCNNKSLFPCDAFLNSGVERRCREFIEELLVTCPQERLSASQALNNRWVISVSNAEECSENLSYVNLTTPGLAELTISAMNYNTSTHDGLKSWDAHVDGGAESSYGRTRVYQPPGEYHKAESRHHDRTVQIWGADTGECIQTLKGHVDWTWSVVFSHDSSLVASASEDTTVQIWRADTGQCLETLRGHTDGVLSVAFSHDSALIVSASYDRTVRIWRTDTGKCIRTFEGHSYAVLSVAFSHNSTLIASASFDKTVRIWRADTGKCVQILRGHSGEVNSVAFSHNSALVASASEDRMVRIWRADTGQCVETLRGHTDGVLSVAFSHNSTLIASASFDKTVRIWRADTGKSIQTLRSGGVRSVAFSHNSTLVVLALYDKTVSIWRTDTGNCIQTLEGHGDLVTSVAFSHDSALVASASDDRTVRIWRAEAGYGERGIATPSVLRSSFQ